jgi:hypothetical protein
MAALPLPFLLDDAPAGYRSIQAAILGMSFGRVIEIVRAPWRFGRGERAVRVLTIFEPRLMKRVPRSAPVKASSPAQRSAAPGSSSSARACAWRRRPRLTRGPDGRAGSAGRPLATFSSRGSRDR